MRTFLLFSLISLPVLFYSCKDNETDRGLSSNGNGDLVYIDSSAADEYTYAQPDDAVIRHLDLDIEVDFNSKSIRGTALYIISNKTKAGKIYFDTKNMDIEKVTLGEQGNTRFALGEYKEFLGRRLEVFITSDTREVIIHYVTNPDAIALQWLAPQQTYGKKSPFLFTQSEPAMARSWVPTQDSPGIRFTYNAKVKVAKGLMAVMSASNPQQLSEDGVYHFEMKQRIPAYLLALAVGNIEFKKIGPRTGVYSEPGMLSAAVYEFGELEDMLKTVENIYGTYRWDRYDVIVLPPSFPFGGMENPRITFLTPTVLAGDRSLVTLVAHELSHSWSGNLVTNATWNDFWLNEGFTVYLEKRIMEALYGRSYAEMLNRLSMDGLMTTIDDIGADHPDTHLKLKLDGRDPDVAMTDIAYDKGAFFLRTAEEAAGRKRWDEFLRKYFDTFAFQSMTSEKFIQFMKKELIGNDTALERSIMPDRWVFGPGIPDNCTRIVSERLNNVEAEVEKWKNGQSAEKLATKEWTTHEWVHFLLHLPDTMTLKQMEHLDKTFSFTSSGNAEILTQWLIHSINNHYSFANDKLEEFLKNIGRRKFLRPIYQALAKTKEGMEKAKHIYKEARLNYHSISTSTIDELLGWEKHNRALIIE